MPKRPRSGPPYMDIPEEVYVVVTNPWGMHSNPRQRSQGDFNRVASWAQFALQQAGLTGGQIPTIECIYGMGTRDEIILQFSEGTNILPLLGKHHWAGFWTHCQDPQDPRSTCVFIYNWKNNGDPANHNWTENYPRNLSLDSVPAKSPYPAPSWTSPPPTLTNLVLPIPRPPVLLPMPDRAHNPGEEQLSVISPPSMKTPALPRQMDHVEPGEQPVAQDSVSTSLFRPYEPPLQHPSYAQFLNRSQTGGQDAETLSSQMSPPSPKFIKKLDPYELDEDALDFIRSSHPEEGTKEVKEEDIKPDLPLSVKAEDREVKREEDDDLHVIASSPGYRPYQALIDAVNCLGRHEESPPSLTPLTHDARGLNAASQTVPPGCSGYRPSAEVEAEINAFLFRTAASLPSGGDARTALGTCVAVKREYEEDVVPLPEVGTRKKIKVEED